MRNNTYVLTYNSSCYVQCGGFKSLLMLQLSFVIFTDPVGLYSLFISVKMQFHSIDFIIDFIHFAENAIPL